MDAVKSEPKRTYDSSGRRHAAERRRRRAIEIAAILFGERGVDATTLADIAAAADVSVPYLQAIGTKVELVGLAVSLVTAGPDQQTPEDFARSRQQLLAVATPEEFVELVAKGTVEWNARSYGLWRAWAECSDQALRESWARHMRFIRREWQSLLDDLGQRGWWREDVASEERAAAVWMLTMAETYERMVRVAGLSDAQYRAWLARSLRDALIGPASS